MNNSGDMPFGEIVDIYTRKDALADGEQIDVSKAADEMGIRFPVFLTRAVYEQCVTVPEGVTSENEAGRLGDILDVLKAAIRDSRKGTDRLRFALYFRNGQTSAEVAHLIASCDPLDADNPQPAITVMLPDED